MRILPLIAALWVSVAATGCAMASGEVTFAPPRSEAAAEGYGDYLSARFAAIHHDLDEAAKFYRSSLDHDPANTQLLTLAFLYAASAGRIDQAAELAERLVASEPDDRAARLTLAVVALKHRGYKKALAQITKSAQGPFTSFTIALISAWAAAGIGDMDTMADALKTLHAQKGAEALAYFNEALLYEFLGQTDKAEAAYRIELQIAGNSPRLVDAYGRFLERNGRTKEASALYEKAAADNANLPIANAGMARIAMGKKPDALVTHAEEGAAEALFGVAASLSNEASADISILYLRLTLYLQPNLDLANLLLAGRFESLGKYDDAIAIYGSISHDSPYYRIAAVEIAIDKSRMLQTDAAIADLQALAVVYPADVETWTALGDVFRQAKKYPDAAKAYDRAILAAGQPTKKNWPLYYARAIAEQQANNWQAAEADLKLALKLSPNEPQVLNYLGYSWVDQRRHLTEALAMLEKARALSPQDGYITDSLGWAYYRLGRYREAARTLESAVLLVPGDPIINDHLGDAYWKIGMKLDARFQWSHALAFGAEEADKARIEKKLKDGLTGDVQS